MNAADPVSHRSRRCAARVARASGCRTAALWHQRADQFHSGCHGERAEDEPLFLGRLIRTQNFIGGYSFEDAGFVLGVKGDSKKFYNMPTGEELARLQRSGFLLSPLPDYQPGFLDYLVGYSLWLVVLLIVGGFALDHWRKRRKLAAETLQAPH
jgi:hypothetical protein